MGTWGTGIYEDDLALDVRDAFRELHAAGKPPAKIEQAIADEFISPDSQDDNDVVTLALCCAELETATLTDETKEKALEIIASDRQYEFWKREATEADAKARKEELAQIQLYIESYDGIAVERTTWKELDGQPKKHTAPVPAQVVRHLLYGLGFLCLLALGSYTFYTLFL